MKRFKLDDNYFKEVENYTKKDAFIAIIFYIFAFFVHIVMGLYYNKEGVTVTLIGNIILVIMCIIIIKLKKQKLSSLGFTKNHFKKSFILGFVTGIIVTILNNIESMLMYLNLQSVGMIISLSFYYFFIIGLVEEILFRGYIQTRMYGLIKNEILCVTIVGLLFMLMHIPFRLFASDLTFFAYFTDNWITLIMTFVWHFAFNHLYMKYNSIVAPTIFHGFMNLSNKLFY